VKVLIEARLHTDGSLIKFLSAYPHGSEADGSHAPAMSSAASGSVQELIRHDDLPEDDYLAAMLVGHPDEDLKRGMVLISCGPISIECCADELHRALLPFVPRKP
jgi:hypothetical protein